jgi:hypothetical protein
MLPVCRDAQASVPPPAYHRAQRRLGPVLHLDALTLVRRLHLLALRRLAVRYAHWRWTSSTRRSAVSHYRVSRTSPARRPASTDSPHSSIADMDRAFVESDDKQQQTARLSPIADLD